MEKERKNTRRNRGITLIALVITVIILLILAGISIAELTGTGIFVKAEEAKQKYKEAEDLENQILANYEAQLNSLGKSTVGSGDVTEGNGDNGDGGDEGMQGDQPPTSQGQSASDIAQAENKSEVYGKQVTNYTEGGVNWDIFYADENNIYLIADDYIERSQLPAKNGKKPNDGSNTFGKRTAYFNNVITEYQGSADITDSRIKALNNDYFNVKQYTSTNKNMKAVAYMLDTEIWKKFAKEDVTDYAIGGPTIELLFKSYNATHKTSYVAGATGETGYEIKKQASDSWSSRIDGMLKIEKPYVINDVTNAYSMWLASPSYYNSGQMMLVRQNGNVFYESYDIKNHGFRPLVCLKSEIQLQKEDNGNYIIVNEQ